MWCFVVKRVVNVVPGMGVHLDFENTWSQVPFRRGWCDKGFKEPGYGAPDVTQFPCVAIRAILSQPRRLPSKLSMEVGYVGGASSEANGARSFSHTSHT